MFSIIVCSNRPEQADFIQGHYERLFRCHAHEFILIRDAKSLCEGYSRGFEQSTGEFVIFSHDDIEFVTPDAPARLALWFDKFDVVGIAGTTKLIDGAWASAGDPHCFLLVVYPETNGKFSVRYAGGGPLCVPDIQALDGCFFACRRKVVDAIGFDLEVFDGFHLYDLDFTFRAHLNGFRLAVCRDIALIHASIGTPDDNWRKYRERFEVKFQQQFSPGTPGDMKVVGVVLRKDQLAQVCAPEYLQRAIRWS